MNKLKSFFVSLFAMSAILSGVSAVAETTDQPPKIPAEYNKVILNNCIPIKPALPVKEWRASTKAFFDKVKKKHNLEEKYYKEFLDKDGVAITAIIVVYNGNRDAWVTSIMEPEKLCTIAKTKG